VPVVWRVVDVGEAEHGDPAEAIEEAGLSFILGARIGDVPYVVDT
jgi:hypothetical protein